MQELEAAWWMQAGEFGMQELEVAWWMQAGRWSQPSAAQRLPQVPEVDFQEGQLQESARVDFQEGQL